MKDQLIYFLRAILLTLGILLAFNLCNLVGSAVQSRRAAQESTVTVKTDTTFIHDTIIVREPVLRIIRQTDTLLVKVQTTDTLRLRDTLYIQLPREQKEYSGDDYRAWVSGYRPQLDSLQIYPQTQLITNTVTYPKPKPKMWGIGIQTGYGAVINGNQVITSPYIGVGISWNMLTF